MKRIDDNELIQMIEAGTPQRDIAKQMNVSESAISQRVSKLKRAAVQTEALEGLTQGQQTFALCVASGMNQTEAALQAFNCSDRDSARVMGCQTAKHPDVSEAIQMIMASEGLDRRSLVKRLKRHVYNDIDANISLRATTEGLKLMDCYPAAKNLNVNFESELPSIDLSRFFNKG